VNHEVLVSRDLNEIVYNASLIDAVQGGRLRNVYSIQPDRHPRVQILTGMQDVIRQKEETASSCDKRCKMAIGLGVGLGIVFGIPTITVAAYAAAVKRSGTGLIGCLEIIKLFLGSWVIALLTFPTTVVLFCYLLRCKSVYYVKNKSTSVVSLIVHTDEVKHDTKVKLSDQPIKEEGSAVEEVEEETSEKRNPASPVISPTPSVEGRKSPFSYKMTVVPRFDCEMVKLSEGEERKFVLDRTLYVTLASFTRRYEPTETTDSKSANKQGKSGHIIYLENHEIQGKYYVIGDDDLIKDPVRFVDEADWDEYVKNVSSLNPLPAEDDETQVPSATSSPERMSRISPRS